MKTIKRKSYKAYRGLMRASPTIFSCVACIGVVLTAIETAKCTPKAMKLLEKKRERKQELSKFEVVCSMFPAYIPSIICGASTIICIFGANALNKKQQASLAGAYALMNESFKRYKDASVSVYGDDAIDRIEAEVAKKTYVSADGYSLYDCQNDTDEVLFYDYCGDRYFNATIAQVINAEYRINRTLYLRGYAYLNELYEFIGLSKINGGNEIGWDFETLPDNGVLWLDFENRLTKMDGGIECYIMSPVMEPYLLDY